MNDQADLEYDAIIQQAHLARAAVISEALRRFGSWIGHFLQGSRDRRADIRQTCLRPRPGRGSY